MAETMLSPRPEPGIMLDAAPRSKRIRIASLWSAGTPGPVSLRTSCLQWKVVMLSWACFVGCGEAALNGVSARARVLYIVPRPRAVRRHSLHSPLRHTFTRSRPSVRQLWPKVAAGPPPTHAGDRRCLMSRTLFPTQRRLPCVHTDRLRAGGPHVLVSASRGDWSRGWGRRNLQRPSAGRRWPSALDVR